MVAKTDAEKRKQILDALEVGGLTINQLSAEVGFNARCIVSKMQMDKILQFGEEITDPISGRGAMVVEICQAKDQAKILHSVLCGMVTRRGISEKRNGGG